MPLARYAGKVALVVNTASHCGFTPQYAALETLHRALGPRGLTVLGFPCNQFRNQEPEGEGEIARFCRVTYDVTFPLFAKVDVKGPRAHPLFRWLAQAAPGLLGSRMIKWNFTKFLLDRDGRPVARFAPFTRPEAIRKPAEALLARL